MNIFKNYRIYLILAWMLFNGFSCQECEESLRDTASFSIRVDSAQTVLELGDTLFLGVVSVRKLSWITVGCFMIIPMVIIGI